MLDVILQSFNMKGTYRKRSIALLPIKRGQLGILLFDPFGGFTLELADEFGDRLHFLKAAQDVNVIFHAVDFFRHAAEIIHDAAEISVQTTAPFLLHIRHAVFGAENQMIVQAQMR